VGERCKDGGECAAPLGPTEKSYFTCGGATVPAELPDENQHLLMESGRLRGEYRQHTHNIAHTHSTLVHTHTYRCRGLASMARGGVVRSVKGMAGRGRLGHAERGR
jgi:hypothetical protein